MIKVEAEAGVSGPVGIGIPGSVDPATGLAKGASSTWLNGKPVEADLRRALGREARIANDADRFAVSEAVDGAGAGHNVVFAVILGSGAGAEWPGARLIMARTTAPASGATIRSPDQMSLRSLVLPAIAADTDASSDGSPAGPCTRLPPARQYRHGPPSRRPQSRSGQSRKASDLPSWCGSRYVDRVARGLSVVINTLDPDILVLGGGMANVDELYDDLPPRLADETFSPCFYTPIVRAAHGDSSGVRGAAWLWR